MSVISQNYVVSFSLSLTDLDLSESCDCFHGRFGFIGELKTKKLKKHKI